MESSVLHRTYYDGAGMVCSNYFGPSLPDRNTCHIESTIITSLSIAMCAAATSLGYNDTNLALMLKFTMPFLLQGDFGNVAEWTVCSHLNGIGEFTSIRNPGT